MRSRIHTADQNSMVRLISISVIMSLLAMINAPVHANNDPLLLKRQEALLCKRVDVQKQIQNAERQLHHLEQNRMDKLEELAELSRAHADLDQRHSFSKDLENEIADQSRTLHRIEEQRSDCLEELDGLCRNLSQINRDVADCDRELH